VFDVDAYTFDSVTRDRVRVNLGLSADTQLLIHVARFGSEKNHQLDVDILAELVARGHDTRLLLVGDGELRPAIERLLQERNLTSRAYLLGIRTDIPQLLHAADIMLLPSVFEGLPYTVLEGQAAGLPCIVSDRVPLEISAGGTVIFVPLSASAREWADEVEKALAASGGHRDQNPLTGSRFDATSSAQLLKSYLHASGNE
jgi:glycosyltransferase involved in cell wall biosynthesis